MSVPSDTNNERVSSTTVESSFSTAIPVAAVRAVTDIPLSGGSPDNRKTSTVSSVMRSLSLFLSIAVQLSSIIVEILAALKRDVGDSPAPGIFSLNGRVFANLWRRQKIACIRLPHPPDCQSFRYYTYTKILDFVTSGLLREFCQQPFITSMDISYL